MNWAKELEQYESMLGWDEDRKQDYDTIPEHKAKERLREHLEFIIGTNGWGELYDNERELAKELNIEEN